MRLYAKKRPDSELNHELLWLSVAVLVLVSVLVLPFLPKLNYSCLFHKLTGKPCLTCGITRSLQAALHGRLLLALRWNPFGFILVLGTTLYVPYALTVVLFRLPPLHVQLTRRWEKPALLVLLLALVIANWIYLWNNGMPY